MLDRIIARQQPILLPILSLIPLWVWPIYWATDCWVTIVAGQLGDGGLKPSMLVLYWQLVARQRTSPGYQTLEDRATKWVWPFNFHKM